MNLKKCKRIGCNNRCMLPSWLYCSDECNRLETNRKQAIIREKRLALKNGSDRIIKVVSETPRIIS